MRYFNGTHYVDAFGYAFHIGHPGMRADFLDMMRDHFKPGTPQHPRGLTRLVNEIPKTAVDAQVIAIRAEGT